MEPAPDTPEQPLPGPRRRGELVSAEGNALVRYTDLRAPAPVPATPPQPARYLAFLSIVVGGMLGALIGWGVADLLAGGEVWPAVGALVGGVSGAVGVGIVAALTLRAMNEWRSVRHPEAG